jgi:PAS domain S-box-containing protein
MAFAANAMPALMAYVDTSVQYLWVNDAYSRWFGRPRDEIQGRHASEVLGPAAWVAVKPYTEQALAGEEVAFDNRVVLEGGVTRDVRASYVPHRDDDGRICGFVAMVTDITETRAVERALRRSEQLLKRSQMAAQVGSWEVTFDERFSEVPGSFFWSSETYRIFGVQPSTPATLALFYSRVHPDDLGAMQARRQPNLRRAESYESEYRIVRPDGEVRMLHSWLDFEPRADGTMHVFGTCQDITDRKRAELELQRSRQQLQLVADTTPALIARYDRDRRVVWANKSYAARFGKTPEELVGSRVVDLVGEAAAQVIEPFSRRVLEGESLQRELEIPYASGPRWIHMVATPTRDTAGVVDGSVLVLTDVTEGRRLERERERALNDLREADRRKDEFLAMLSHELRNPLGPILNAVEVLERLEPGDEARPRNPRTGFEPPDPDADLGAQSREVIARQAKHMKRLLDDLLDVSRVSQGKIALQKQRIDLNVLLGQAVAASRPMMIEKRHTLSIALAPEPMELEADPTRLLQVFDNLLNNAAKYTDPGGHIAIAATVEGGEAVATMRDDGIGMTPDLLARAFDLFVQGTRSLDRTQGGLGIGLTLVQTLVRMHGGSVRAFSDGPGRGSQLVVRLPLAAPARSAGVRPLLRQTLAPPAERRARPAPTPAAGAGAPLRVLVVDDNVDAAKALGQLLTSDGHEVTLAHHGLAALAAATAAQLDLVLLDIGLPGMDGYEVAARLRAAGHAGTALVALTGYGREDDIRRSRDAGFDHHLVKPIDFAELLRVVLEVRDRRARGSGGSA